MRPRNDQIRKEIMSYIHKHRGQKGYSPSIREISKAVNRSTTAVWHHVQVLVSEGKLENAGVARGLIPLRKN
jgi:SOS-response transcriptional repressor LexA